MRPRRQAPASRLITGLLALAAGAAIAVLSLETRSAGLSFVTGGFGLGVLLLRGATLVAARPGLIAGVPGLLASWLSIGARPGLGGRAPASRPGSGAARPSRCLVSAYDWPVREAS